MRLQTSGWDVDDEALGAAEPAILQVHRQSLDEGRQNELSHGVELTERAVHESEEVVGSLFSLPPKAMR